MTDFVVAKEARDSSKVSTRLIDKHYSPLIVRKYQMEGWPLYVSLICDVSLSDLDKVVWDFAEEWKRAGKFENDIQCFRNFCGALSDTLLEHYNSVKTGSVEGIGVLYYVDKCFISSLYGDHMTHLSCRMELYSILQTLPHI